MMRGKEPARVRLDALQRPDVVLEIDVPAGGVSILLSFRTSGQGIEIRFFPETLWQRREPEPGIKLFRRLDDPFRLASLEILVDVRGFDEAFPFLRPAIVDPMRGNLFRDWLMILFSQLVFRPGMELEIQRPQRRHPFLEHL